MHEIACSNPTICFIEKSMYLLAHVKLSLKACYQIGYCKFGNFRENFIFTKSVKRPICDVRSRSGHDLPISVNERVISPIREGLIFMKLRISEVSRKFNSCENFRIYSYHVDLVHTLNGRNERIIGFFSFFCLLWWHTLCAPHSGTNDNICYLHLWKQKCPH